MKFQAAINLRMKRIQRDSRETDSGAIGAMRCREIITNNIYVNVKKRRDFCE